MKAEHRHDLKTNELAVWLNNLPVWTKQHLRTIIYVAVVLVLVAASYLYHHYQKTVVASRDQNATTVLLSQVPYLKAGIARDQAKGIDRSYTLLQMADELDTIANRTKEDAVAALSLIKEGEVLRTEIQFRLGTITREDATNQINRAKDKYNKALDPYLKRSPNISLEALARFGLGLCEEELGNFDQAKNIYKEVATNPAFAPTTSAAAAKQRLAVMDSFTKPLALKSAPKPVPAATPAPLAPLAEQPTIPASPNQMP
ncbi:MAG: hypothetical protein ABSG82_08655 [Sedimentisphaerales bacterium]|jgi:tetratricopeptide (TPR) repeat protein